MSLNIYLDIDGVLLTKQGQPALFVEEFLKYITNRHECFWLTTHCQGNPESAIKHLDGKISARAIEYARKIKPTDFQTWKTEAIDFTQDFRWLDDYAFEMELKDLNQHDCKDKLILIDLEKNPNHLMALINKNLF